MLHSSGFFKIWSSFFCIRETGPHFRVDKSDQSTYKVGQTLPMNAQNVRKKGRRWPGLIYQPWNEGLPPWCKKRNSILWFCMSHTNEDKSRIEVETSAKKKRNRALFFSYTVTAHLRQRVRFFRSNLGWIQFFYSLNTRLYVRWCNFQKNSSESKKNHTTYTLGPP